ncbi:hypothetical protein HK102_003748, partial [Quaeritorhiza haematococci]
MNTSSPLADGNDFSSPEPLSSSYQIATSSAQVPSDSDRTVGGLVTFLSETNPDVYSGGEEETKNQGNTAVKSKSTTHQKIGPAEQNIHHQQHQQQLNSQERTTSRGTEIKNGPPQIVESLGSKYSGRRGRKNAADALKEDGHCDTRSSALRSETACGDESGVDHETAGKNGDHSGDITELSSTSDMRLQPKGMDTTDDSSSHGDSVTAGGKRKRLENEKEAGALRASESSGRVKRGHHAASGPNHDSLLAKRLRTDSVASGIPASSLPSSAAPNGISAPTREAEMTNGSDVNGSIEIDDSLASFDSEHSSLTTLSNTAESSRTSSMMSSVVASSEATPMSQSADNSVPHSPKLAPQRQQSPETSLGSSTPVPQSKAAVSTPTPNTNGTGGRRRHKQAKPQRIPQAATPVVESSLSYSVGVTDESSLQQSTPTAEHPTVTAEQPTLTAEQPTPTPTTAALETSTPSTSTTATGSRRKASTENVDWMEAFLPKKSRRQAAAAAAVAITSAYKNTNFSPEQASPDRIQQNPNLKSSTSPTPISSAHRTSPSRSASTRRSSAFAADSIPPGAGGLISEGGHDTSSSFTQTQSQEQQQPGLAPPPAPAPHSSSSTSHSKKSHRKSTSSKKGGSSHHRKSKGGAGGGGGGAGSDTSTGANGAGGVFGAVGAGGVKTGGVYVPVGLVNPFKTGDDGAGASGAAAGNDAAEQELMEDVIMIRSAVEEIERKRSEAEGKSGNSQSGEPGSSSLSSPHRSSTRTASPAKITAEEEAKNAANDDHCTACLQKGKLLCCDSCPRAFHAACVEEGFEVDNLPEGIWECKQCRWNKKRQLAKSATPEGTPGALASAVASATGSSSGGKGRSRSKRHASSAPTSAPRTPSSSKRPLDLFKELIDDLDSMNPRVFELPREIRDNFEHVWTHPITGAYVDTREYEVVGLSTRGHRSTRNNGGSGKGNSANANNGGTAHSGLDGSTASGALAGSAPSSALNSQPLCYRCRKTGIRLPPTSFLGSYSIPQPHTAPGKSAGVTVQAVRSEMIKCDYCDLHWHLDCLDPPLSCVPPEMNEKETVDSNYMKYLRSRTWGETTRSASGGKKGSGGGDGGGAAGAHAGGGDGSSTAKQANGSSSAPTMASAGGATSHVQQPQRKSLSEELEGVGVVQIRRRWMCPCHVDWALPKKRKGRGWKWVDVVDESEGAGVVAAAVPMVVPMETGPAAVVVGEKAQVQVPVAVKDESIVLRIPTMKAKGKSGSGDNNHKEKEVEQHVAMVGAHSTQTVSSGATKPLKIAKAPTLKLPIPKNSGMSVKPAGSATTKQSGSGSSTPAISTALTPHSRSTDSTNDGYIEVISDPTPGSATFPVPVPGSAAYLVLAPPPGTSPVTGPDPTPLLVLAAPPGSAGTPTPGSAGTPGPFLILGPPPPNVPGGNLAIPPGAVPILPATTTAKPPTHPGGRSAVLKSAKDAASASHASKPSVENQKDHHQNHQHQHQYQHQQHGPTVSLKASEFVEGKSVLRDDDGNELDGAVIEYFKHRIPEGRIKSDFLDRAKKLNVQNHQYHHRHGEDGSVNVKVKGNETGETGRGDVVFRAESSSGRVKRVKVPGGLDERYEVPLRELYEGGVCVDVGMDEDVDEDVEYGPPGLRCTDEEAEE